MRFDVSYLNRTENQTLRANRATPTFVVWHETMSYDDSPQDSLDWCLRREQVIFNPRTNRWDRYTVEASYNYLIARDGRIFHYLDETTRIAWHAGVNTRVRVGGRTYTGGELNVASIGVEVDGPSDGTPITEAQRDAIIGLLLYFQDTYNIPLEREFHVTHREAVAAINPSYRSDPRGYSVSFALQLAQQQRQRVPDPAAVRAHLLSALYRAAGGEYHPEWSFHQYAARNRLGVPLVVGLSFVFGGQEYVAEIYARDAIFTPVPNWSVVQRLSQISDVRLFEGLASFVYSALGLPYNERIKQQAFYYFWRRSNIGLPLAPSKYIRTPGGATYAAQPFAFDLLYTPVAQPEANTNWSDVRRISALLTQPSPSAVERELLATGLGTLYGRLGAQFNPEDRFWQAALQRGLGAPIRMPQQIVINGQPYTYAVFAGDVLFASNASPGQVQALGDLGA